MRNITATLGKIVTIHSSVLILGQETCVLFFCDSNNDSNSDSVFGFSSWTTTKQCQGFSDFTVYLTSVMGGTKIFVYSIEIIYN